MVFQSHSLIYLNILREQKLIKKYTITKYNSWVTRAKHLKALHCVYYTAGILYFLKLPNFALFVVFLQNIAQTTTSL